MWYFGKYPDPDMKTWRWIKIWWFDLFFGRSNENLFAVLCYFSKKGIGKSVFHFFNSGSFLTVSLFLIVSELPIDSSPFILETVNTQPAGIILVYFLYFWLNKEKYYYVWKVFITRLLAKFYFP